MSINLNTNIKSGKNDEKPHTVVYLKNYGNLSGGVITRRIITPSRSVRSLTAVVGSVKSIKGAVGSVGSFRRGIPANGQNFFKNNEMSTNIEDKNNQTISLSNN